LIFVGLALISEGNPDNKKKVLPTVLDEYKTKYEAKINLN
jgi:hypothetical protein